MNRTDPLTDPALDHAPLVRAIAGRYEIAADTGCWNWTGSTNVRGRARVGLFGRDFYAYRVSYAVHVGAIPAGALICHHCDNPRCINPEHLYAGNSSTNMRDAYERNRHPGPPRRSGELNANASLTDERAAEMVRLYATGDYTQAQLADMFGLSGDSVVSAIVRGRRGYRTPFAVDTGAIKAMRLAECGTVAAYSRHKRAGEVPCDPCRQARREWFATYARNRRNKGRAS